MRGDFEIIKEGMKKMKDKKFFNSLKNDFSEYRNNFEKRVDFNLGLFYGLFFGILGNLFIYLFFDLYGESMPYNLKWSILVIIAFTLAFFIWIMRKEHIISQKNIKELKELEKIEFNPIKP